MKIRREGKKVIIDFSEDTEEEINIVIEEIQRLKRDLEKHKRWIEREKR